MKVHLLDTSALSYLAYSDNILARHRIVAEADVGGIVVLVTHPLLWELAGARAVNQAHYNSMMDLLWRITRRRVLLRTPDRLEKEVSRKRALVYPEYVDDEHVLDLPRDAEEIDTAAAAYAGAAAGLVFHEMERATDAIDALEEDARRQAREQGAPYDPKVWRRALGEQFKRTDYVLDHMEHHAHKDMHDVAEATGLGLCSLAPRDAPTAWARAMVHVARQRAVVLGGTSPRGRKSPGPLDLTHLKEAAAYADVFVTRDGRLRTFATMVHGLRCEVVLLEDWVARL